MVSKRTTGGKMLGRCPLCGRSVRTVEHKYTITIAAAKVEGTVIARACAKCDDVFIEPVEIASFEVRAAAALVRAGWFKGGVLRAARKALGYPASQLAALLDVAPETVSRWESDTREAPRAVFLWLHERLVHHGRRSSKKHAHTEMTEPIAPATRPPRLRLDQAA